MSSVEDTALCYLVLQYLREQGYECAAHEMEKAWGRYFDIEHLHTRIRKGDWREVISYLKPFVRWREGPEDRKVCFEVGRQRFLEAASRGDKKEACLVLLTDLQELRNTNIKFYQDFYQASQLEDIRDYAMSKNYPGHNQARESLIASITPSLQSILGDKIVFPSISQSGLHVLMKKKSGRTLDIDTEEDVDDVNYIDTALLFMIMDFLKSIGFDQSLHRLESESGIYFDSEYVRENLELGEWDKVMTYVRSFIEWNASKDGDFILFELGRQRLIEAFVRNDRREASRILMQDLSGLQTSSEKHYVELTRVIQLDNLSLWSPLRGYTSHEQVRGDVYRRMEGTLKKALGAKTERVEIAPNALRLIVRG
ncbi:hypothetical protein PROFUN_02582 [Planoprotostelium fungivorum]|uniref:CTLH domain-containing protein n=1 Tax=Planoprotostelium fungivorum TaxID=1890364 RepID=A0A2P6MPD6_9EUKA|nr:hypothetical protein PROFUN_02582 [Planoprotostelium fungivorum]